MNEKINAYGFAGWLEERADEAQMQQAKKFNPVFARRLSFWRNATDGCTADVGVVDRILIDCFPDIGFWEIPDELFCEHKPRRRYDDEEKRRAVERLFAGESRSAVAKDINVAVDTLARWRHEQLTLVIP